jgi:tetratricopeptide (TPR) repeat protein/ferredoxin
VKKARTSKSSSARTETRDSTGRPEKRSPPDPLPVSKYSKWRALVLASVYVLMAVHVVHWRMAEKTLAPLELHEVMFTAELGIITAGFLLMGAVTLATMLFGRFFCSWACHIMALQELAAWLLGKLGIRPRPIRSRLLLWVPPLVLLYMFGWPQISRMWAGRDFPTLRTQTDLDGISSFVTTDFWRNLPDPWITALTFFVCGFLIVYVLGSRAFCTYGCPYGALFLTIDRFAPGRIRVDDSCVQCGTCTAVCTSGVRVHEEVDRHGTIVNPRCLKDLDCVSACPENALHYTWGAPTLTKLWGGRWILLGLGALTVATLAVLLVPGAQTAWGGRLDLVPFGLAVALLGLVAYGRTGMPHRKYHFSWSEELLMAVLFVTTLVVYRQLYDAIPFLLTVGLGGVASYSVIVLVRLFTRSNVRVIDYGLKRSGRLLRAGWIYAVAVFAFLAFTAHSAMVQYHTRAGYAAFERSRAAAAAGSQVATELAGGALDHLQWSARWGLFRSKKLQETLATLLIERGDFGRATVHLQQVVERDPVNAAARTELGRSLMQAGRYPEAEQHLREALRVRTSSASSQRHLQGVQARACYYLAEALTAQGRPAEAQEALREALRLEPDFAQAHYNLGGLLLEERQIVEGEQHFREAVRLQPAMAAAHYNLGVALMYQARLNEAILAVETSLGLAPTDSQARELLAHLRRQEAAGFESR